MKDRLSGLLLTLAISLSSAHAQAGDPATRAVRAQIQAAIVRMAAATRAKDIDAYMALVPPDFSLHQDDGSSIDRTQLRANILQMWSVIVKTRSLRARIDKIVVLDDNEATVFTSQRWSRVMLNRDGVSRSNVYSTEKHKEHWRIHDGAWFCYGVEEMGGEIWINGKRPKA